MLSRPWPNASTGAGQNPELHHDRTAGQGIDPKPFVPRVRRAQAVDENGKVVTEETLLDDGDFLLLLVEPGDRPDADEVPIREFAQINDAIGEFRTCSWHPYQSSQEARQECQQLQEFSRSLRT